MTRVSERAVPFNAFLKLLSPYPSFVFLNLGIHPDIVTVLSFFFIGIAAALFAFGHAVFGVTSLFCFILLDSVDGDMARVVGPTSYGRILDSFGADFFYASIPSSIGFYLYASGIESWYITEEMILVIGFLVSVTFLLYRVINIKIVRFLDSTATAKNGSVQHEEGLPKANVRLPMRLAKYSRHIVIRGNFFGEPGMTLWFSVLLLGQWYAVLLWYLVAILLYNLLFLAGNLARAYVSFKSAKN